MRKTTIMSSTEARTATRGISRTELWAALSALVGAVGVLGPFATYLVVTINGTSTGDGRLTLGLIAAGAIILAVARWQDWRWVNLLAAAVFAVGAYILIHDTVQLERVNGAQIGWGMWFAIVGCVSATVASVALIRRQLFVQSH